MKVLLIIFFMGLSVAYTQSDLWVQMDSLNGPPRANAVAFVVQENGYVVTGYDGFQKKRSMVSYDPTQDDWDDELKFGGDIGDGLNRSSAVSFEAYGYGFVALGEGNSFMFTDLWMYDPYYDTWTQMANFIGDARTQAIAFSIDNIGYVGTGKGSDNVTLHKDLYAYDFLNNVWTQKADFPGTARFDAFGVKMGGKAYVGLGYDGSSYPNDFYEYFPENDSWMQKADFPGTPRINTTAFAVFPQLFITTGDDGFNYLKDTWEYNYFGDVWTQKTDFPGDARSGAISFTINGRAYVGSGFGNGNYYDDFYEYAFILNNEDPIHLNSKVYPNPSKGNFFLNTGKNIHSISTIKLFDIYGKNIPIQIKKQSKQRLSISTNSESLKNGTYYLVIFDQNKLILKQPIVILK